MTIVEKHTEQEAQLKFLEDNYQRIRGGVVRLIVNGWITESTCRLKEKQNE